MLVSDFQVMLPSVLHSLRHQPLDFNIIIATFKPATPHIAAHSGRRAHARAECVCGWE